MQHEQGKKVLVTGGAGFLGINLIRHLLERGYRTASLDLEDFDYPERDRVETFTGDIRDRAAVDRAMADADFVVHTAAALPLYSAEDIYTTDVEGTRTIMDAAERNGVERAVHVSSTAVYGIPDHHPLYETDKLEGVGPYGQAKIQAEMICLEYRARGLTVPIIRPKSFVGPERLGVFALLYDWAHTGHNFPMIGSGDNLYQLMDVEDLCDAIALTLSLPEEQVDDTFNIGARVFSTMKDDYQVVLDAAGHGKKVVGFPALPAILGLRFLDALGVSPLYKWVYETASKDSFVSIEKAEKQLGYNPKHSNKDALLRNYRWYIDNLPRFEKESGVSHRVPWKQGAIGLLKKVF
ncbi:NAD-dependent epimerase/dehydratase family protein [Rubrobacter aplysinae]|uniref:NAD-dependent epimerase/dehydratase family protein n=1 Tax=Rubrobacter aplysinae TaxID=909625 RepID=UPI00064BAF0E|nr:NAD-dependent epimerase/dehydratase family protein [Rubrobacter aplysinae]